MDYGIKLSGKEGRCDYKGKSVRWFNQGCPEWTHPYEYENNGSNLRTAGCGVFSMCVVIQQLCGEEIEPEWLADYSVACGGRGDDGTDRPALLAGMVNGGLDEKFGFRYDGDGLVNDHEKLWQLLLNGGFALCNLRVGHIVAVIDWREVDGERQMLVVDSSCESSDKRIRDNVREILPDSKCVNMLRNAAGLEVGLNIAHSMYWVPVSLARDFNLIWKR